jgi:hypothetical protein
LACRAAIARVCYGTSASKGDKLRHSFRQTRRVEQTFWRPRGDSGPLGTAEALSHFARYVPYLATVGTYGVLVGR